LELTSADIFSLVRVHSSQQNKSLDTFGSGISVMGADLADVKSEKQFKKRRQETEKITLTWN
jgi:hypothetical protein